MVTIGSDCHLKTSTMSVLDDNGEKIMRSKLDNEPEVLLKFVRQFPHPKQFAIETCYNWPAVYELLKDEVDEFHLLHAKKLKSIVESQNKCDNNDADEIARLTHVETIHELSLRLFSRDSNPAATLPFPVGARFPCPKHIPLHLPRRGGVSPP